MSEKVREYLQYKRVCRVVYETLSVTPQDVNKMSKKELEALSYMLKDYMYAAGRCAELRKQFTLKWIEPELRNAGHEYPITRAEQWASRYRSLLNYVDDKIATLDQLKAIRKQTKSAKSQRTRSESSDDLSSIGDMLEDVHFEEDVFFEEDVPSDVFTRPGKSKRKKKAKGKKVKPTMVEEDDFDFSDSIEQVKRDRRIYREKKQKLYEKLEERVLTAIAEVLDLPYLESILRPYFKVYTGQAAPSKVQKALEDDLYTGCLSLFMYKGFGEHGIYNVSALKSTLEELEKLHTMNISRGAIAEVVAHELDDADSDEEAKKSSASLNDYRLYFLSDPDEDADKFIYTVEYNKVPDDTENLALDAHTSMMKAQSTAAPRNWLERSSKEAKEILRNPGMKLRNDETKFIDTDKWIACTLKTVYLLQQKKFNWKNALNPVAMEDTWSKIDLRTIPQNCSDRLYGYVTDEEYNIEIVDLMQYVGWVLKQAHM